MGARARGPIDGSGTTERLRTRQRAGLRARGEQEKGGEEDASERESGGGCKLRAIVAWIHVCSLALSLFSGHVWSIGARRDITKEKRERTEFLSIQRGA